MAVFSSSELQRRANEIKRLMARKNLDCVVTFSTNDTSYVSGVPLVRWQGGRPSVAIVPKDGEPALIVSWIEKYNSDENSWIRDIRPYTDERKVIVAVLDLVREILENRGLVTGLNIGTELNGLTVADYTALKERLPATNFVDISDDLESLRTIKSEEEIKILKIAAEVSIVGAKAFVEAMKAGATELEISSKSVYAMEKWLGRKYPESWSSTFAYCHSGLRTLSPHACSTGRKIKSGELICMNVFPVVWGYVGELERTLVMGRLSREQKKPLEVMIDAFRKATDAVKPGVQCSAIDKLARKIIQEAGLAQFVTHGTGHSFGIESTGGGREESGEVRIYNDRELAAGMVISIEPGIYVPSVGGFRHSDMILVTKDGHEVLTDYENGIVSV